MNWIKLESPAQLEEIKDMSQQQPAFIFKHSTRCSISSTALNRLERNWKEIENLQTYYLDLIAYRGVSNQIAEIFGVEHQSPQVLLIQNGVCTYDTSHLDISFDGIFEAVKM
jgi:bacillithiol system protein YtxJ